MAEEIDKYEEDVDRLIETGKEKGYLTYGEVNDLLPGDITSPDDLDDLLTTINTQGIDVLSGDGRRGRGRGEDRDEEEGEAGMGEDSDVELDLSPGTLEKTNDPVRMYLREMGTVPLLTREGEVEIAKRIEQGEREILHVVIGAQVALSDIVTVGEALKAGKAHLREVVRDYDEESDHSKIQTWGPFSAKTCNWA